MSNFKLYTDSTADLAQEIVELIDVTVVPTEFFVRGQRYLDYPDEREMSKKDFFSAVRDGEMPITAVIPPNRFYEYFESDAKAGIPVLYIVFSTGLTTTFQNATIAVNELRDIYPETTDIRIVDSLSASLGEGALVYYAGMMRKEGKSRDEIADWVEANRLCAHVWFTVDDLTHLRRGGRISATAAAVGGVLHIKPLLTMDVEGHLFPAEKVRGRKSAIETIIKKVKQFSVTPENQVVFVAHADCLDDANWMRDCLLNDVGVKEVFIAQIGPVIGSHAGPGCLGCLFMGNPRA